MLLQSSLSVSFSFFDKSKLPRFLSSSAPIFNHVNGSSSVRFSKTNVGCGGVVQGSMEGPNNRPVWKIAFEPFEEVKKELLLIPNMPHASLARHKYNDQCEAALNAQIK